MLHNVEKLTEFNLGATDGEIGSVEEVYFDDESWTVRYLIVNTGSWLFGRKVLLSPTAIQHPDWENKIFPVNLNRDQVKNSPDINLETPVSRQSEIDLYNHYGWPFAGNPVTGIGFYGMMGMTGMTDSRVPLEDIIAAQHTPVDLNQSKTHLQSSKIVRGYQIHTIDGTIGEVEDFLIDDYWNISFLIVDTGNWFPGKKVLISPKWISKITPEESSVYVDLSKDAVKNSPEYDHSIPVNDSYVAGLNRYYGRE